LATKPAPNIINIIIIPNHVIIDNIFPT